MLSAEQVPTAARAEAMMNLRLNMIALLELQTVAAEPVGCLNFISVSWLYYSYYELLVKQPDRESWPLWT